jgi:hypothetical protein
MKYYANTFTFVTSALLLLVANATGVAQERQRPEPRDRAESERADVPQDYQEEERGARGRGARVRPQEPDEPIDELKRQREGGIPRAKVQQDETRSQEGTEEGAPELRVDPQGRAVEPYVIPPERRRWLLGVFAYNTDTGIVITRVVPRSAAARVGLEPGDRIVSVDGYQVGWVQDHLYPLGEELQRQAGRRGRVLLLVQNVRDRGLLNIDVELDRRR